MNGHSLLKTYRAMLAMGLTRSQPDFSIRWCGRGKTYLRDFALREGRDRAPVPPFTADLLRSRLQATAARMPCYLRREIEAVVAWVDRAEIVEAQLSR